MHYPSYLQEGGTIGFIAPSFGCNIEPYYSAFLNAQKQFKKLGYACRLGENVYKGDGIGISTTPQKCGEEIMREYASKESDVLISCGGGELMCEDLNYVDFAELTKANPKWFMGYSDNTNLTFLLATLCDTAAIYAPCAPAFGMEPWHESVADAFAILRGSRCRKSAEGYDVFSVRGYDRYELESKKDGEHPLEPYHVTEQCKRIGFPDQDGMIEGRLIGGCLDILVNMVGTRFDGVSEYLERYKEDGFIWFIEACDLNTMAMRRAIWQMDAAGWFQYVKGILVGRPYHHGEVDYGLDQYHAITDLLSKYEVPIMMDLDIGHIPPMMPLIVGSYAKATLQGNEFYLEMELRP